MTCGVIDQKLLVPFVQAEFACGREYRGKFVQALRCPTCAYVRFPAPPEAVLNRYYAEEYPASSRSWYNVTSDYGPWKTDKRASNVIEVISRFGFEVGASLHEFGCAFGGTVDALYSRGYDASGTELNAGAVAEGRARGNTRIFAESALDYLARKSKAVQVVYSFHAIEHFTDPFDFIAEVSARIDPDGIIILIVPNSAALFPLVYGHARYVWFGYPEHLHLFSPRSALSFAERVGCELLHIESTEFGIEPDATARALSQEGQSAALLRHADRSLLGEELIFVLTPAKGQLAARYKLEANHARTRCLLSGRFEERAMAANEKSTVNPWPIGG